MNPEQTENNQNSEPASGAPNAVPGSEQQTVPVSNSTNTPATTNVSTPTNLATTTSVSKSKNKNKLLSSLLLVALVVALFSTGFYIVGKHGQRVIIKAPTPPPITLPRQTILVSNCVPGLGKEYIIPNDIPTGPIYYTENKKVIAVEYDYKAVDIYLNPNLLSNAIIPLTKDYQIAGFTTKIGSLDAASAEVAQNDQIQLIMYVVSKAEAQKITCPT